jgi:hypothetical protein
MTADALDFDGDKPSLQTLHQRSGIPPAREVSNT